MTGVLNHSLALGCKEHFSVYGFSFQFSAFLLLLFWAQEEPDVPHWFLALGPLLYPEVTHILTKRTFFF